MRYLLLLLPFLTSCSPEIPASYSLDQIKIARDTWGVPHIIAPTDAEVAYGFAWAQCEDSFVTLQEQMLAIRGKLGEVKGKQGVMADFGIQFMGLREIVEDRYEQDISSDFKTYLDQYVDGVNNYATLHPKERLLDALFPLRPQDVVMGYLMGMVELSQARPHLEQILNGSILSEPTNDLPKGSNAIAISANKTKDGKTYLAINSHQPLEGWYSWYEAHLVSEEGLNILGGTFPGGTTIFHGANEDLAWAHTVNHVDLSDVYQLEMHPENKLKYRYDDKWLELEKVTYKAKLKLWGSLKIPIKRKIYRSVYGPTFKTDQGFFSWRFVVAQDIRAIEQWYWMNKATDLASFKSALSMQAIPSTNIVYADRLNNIFFISNAKVPIRDTTFNWRKVLPGNTSKTFWDDFYPLDSLPQVTNPKAGYLYNTNNTPFSATGGSGNPQEKVANQTMTFQNPDMENSRSLRFQELIQQYDSLDYEDFKRIKYDQQYGGKIQAREMMNLDLIFHLDSSEKTPLADIIKVITGWNRQFAIENTAAPVFIYTLQVLVHNLKSEGRFCWRCQITKADVHKALATTQDFFMEEYGTLEVPLGEFQKHTRGTKNLPLGGGPDVMAAIYSEAQPNGTFKGVAGESYIELVRFSSTGVEIESVHAYGASEKPDSPHYSDQMELFVEQKLKSMSLDKTEVLQKAASIYAPRKVVKEKQ